MEIKNKEMAIFYSIYIYYISSLPNSTCVISQEYDADVDDDELMCEQEEWDSRIYINILKSITSSSNENLLKQIEDRVSKLIDCWIIVY